MFLRFRNLLSVGIGAFLALGALGQSPSPSPTPAATPPADVRNLSGTVPTVKSNSKDMTAEQVVESSIFLYGYPGGRMTLNQIRKTTSERGTMTVARPDGQMETAKYQRFVIRGENLDKEKIRLEQEFPTARYSLVYNDKVFLVYNNTVFSPREDVVRSFENQYRRGLEGFLRYKENGSTIELAPKEKIMGVEYHVIDLTDKQGRKTRYYVSAKLLRVAMVTYEEGGINYKRKYYDYNYAQGTLVPYRTVLWANDKIVEEIELGTVTFGQKVDEGLFAAS